MAESVIKYYSDIKSTNTVLFAISCDTVNEQKKFVEKYNIPYDHLSDTSKEISKLYSGLNIVGLPKRSTFIIDRTGRIKKIYHNINVEIHGKEISSFLRNLQ